MIITASPWLMHFKLREGQLAGWKEQLAQYDLYRSGNKHSNADRLS